MKERETPPYFFVPAPAHFCVRPDLIEELCAGEAILRQLCRTEKGYKYWHALTGNSATAPTLAQLRGYSGRGYTCTPRYILRYAVLPQTKAYHAVVVDQREWPGFVEPVGLFDFVFRRAVERIVFENIHEFYPRERLYPARQHNASEAPRFADWSLGYEVRSGHCTLLDRTRADSEFRFLQGEPLGPDDDLMENLPPF